MHWDFGNAWDGLGTYPDRFGLATLVDIAALELVTLAERFDARPWTDEQLEPLFADAFPDYITADQMARLYIDRVREFFGAFNIMLLGVGEIPIATGWAVPIRWNGDLGDLPDGSSGPRPTYGFATANPGSLDGTVS